MSTGASFLVATYVSDMLDNINPSIMAVVPIKTTVPTPVAASVDKTPISVAILISAGAAIIANIAAPAGLER